MLEKSVCLILLFLIGCEQPRPKMPPSGRPLSATVAEAKKAAKTLTIIDPVALKELPAAIPPEKAGAETAKGGTVFFYEANIVQRTASPPKMFCCRVMELRKDGGITTHATSMQYQFVSSQDSGQVIGEIRIPKRRGKYVVALSQGDHFIAVRRLDVTETD